jgi:hypothetical protein
MLGSAIGVLCEDAGMINQNDQQQDSVDFLLQDVMET